MLRGFVPAAFWSVLMASASVGAPNTIVPGSKIGHVQLGQDLSTVTNALGPPGWEDTASGRSWNAWFPAGMSDKELDVYTDNYAPFPDGRPNAGNSRIVEQVRVTSPWFSTRGGLRVGATLATIRRLFPHATLVKYPNSPRRSSVDLYDDRRAGIAFQVLRTRKAPERCVAVIIHPKNKGVLEEYYQVHPDVNWYNLRGRLHNEALFKSMEARQALHPQQLRRDRPVKRKMPTPSSTPRPEDGRRATPVGAMPASP